MRSLSFSIQLIIVLSLPSYLIAQVNGDDILGIWTNEKKVTRFQFSNSDSIYSAKIIWMKNSLDEHGNPKKDINNQDKKLRSRLMTEFNVAWDLKFKSGKWCDGKIYVPDRGVVADCKIEMPQKDTLKITVSKGFLSGVRTWTRCY